MQVSIHPNPQLANAAAAEVLAEWLLAPGVRNVMLPGGNTPLELFRLVASRRLPLAHLNVFALDEYVGVPETEPRNCANLIRRAAVEPWGIPIEQYHFVNSEADRALASLQAMEQRIAATGGLDLVVLGLGQNGHIGFNEPGSTANSPARILDLVPISVAANREWFGGLYAPARGATTGMQTLLAARRVVLLAYGSHKAAAVRAMVQGPRDASCPASFLQAHPQAVLFLDEAAARNLAQVSS